MSRRFTVFLAWVGIIAAFSACAKLDTTTIGTDLIPAVDNIRTFDTTLAVETYQYGYDDSLRMFPGYIHSVGQISSDPVFGAVSAAGFLQVKPLSYPLYWPNKKDSLALDSVVLVLSVRGIYGDTLRAQKFDVYEVDQNSGFGFNVDTVGLFRPYLVANPNIAVSRFLGTTGNLDLRTLNDSVYGFREAARNQLRIKLDNSLGERLLLRDSANAFTNDSSVYAAIKGFRISSVNGGNALVHFALGDTNTKLNIYYRYIRNGKADTTYSTWRFTGTNTGNAQEFKRNFAGAEINKVIQNPPTEQDSVLYVQAAPGMFYQVKVPGLSFLNNRLVHRAELVMEEVGNTDPVRFPPSRVYVDLFDSTSTPPAFLYNFYDLYFAGGGPNFTTYGGNRQTFVDAFGQVRSRYGFTLTRLVQSIVTKKETNFAMRLHAPIDVTYPKQNNITISTGILIGGGQVKLGGGNNKTAKMKLRIIYSKI